MTDAEYAAMIWEKNKERVLNALRVAAVAGLRVSFDDEREVVTVFDGVRRRAQLLPVEAEIELMNWPGSRLEGFDEEGEPIAREELKGWSSNGVPVRRREELPMRTARGSSSAN